MPLADITALRKVRSMIKPPPSSAPTPVPQLNVARPGGSQTVNPATEYWFSALRPVQPTAPVTFRPRQYPFLPGWNLVWPPRTEEDTRLPFSILYQCAAEWELFNCAMETVVDKVASLDWQIRKKTSSETAAAVAQATRDAKADQLTEFFKKPDGIHNFKQWARMLLHDMYIADCATLYCVRQNGDSEIKGFMPIDGSSIKVLLDDMGRTPTGIDPETNLLESAFQQVCYGMPTIDFTADDVIYAVRNPYNQSPYGRSHLEQIITYANMGIRQQNFQLAYFTEGNTPEMLLFVGPDVPAEKIEEWNELLDSNLQGQLGERRKIKLLPGMGADGKPNAIFPKEPLLKSELDEWLARIVCFTLGLSPQAFTKNMNRASGEQAQDTAEAEGQQPVIEWMQDTVNACLAKMGVSGYEFTYRVRREQDSKKQMDVDTGYLKVGAMTLDEVRNDLGLDPYNMPGVSDVPYVETPQGPIKLEQVGELGDATIQSKINPPSPPGGSQPTGNGTKVTPKKPLAKRLVPAALVAEHSLGRKLSQKFTELRAETERQLREKLSAARS